LPWEELLLSHFAAQEDRAAGRVFEPALLLRFF
jgi:hypothetical protein